MLFTFQERQSDSPLVEKVWRAHSECMGAFTSRAAANWEIVVARHHGRTAISVRGPERRATAAVCPLLDAEWCGIVFRPGAFMPQLPPGQIVDRRDASLPEATARSFWLQGSAWEYPCYDNADTFVSRLIRAGMLVHDPLVNAVLEGRPLRVSRRAAQYRFLRATGLTHQAYRQIARAQRALALLERGRSIADTVYETGYYDQPHLTRSLQRFAGQTPAHVASAPVAG